MKKTRFALIAFLSLILSGCGYTSGTLLPADQRTIHIDNFENRINTAQVVSDRREYYGYRPNLETDIRRAVVSRFIFDGNLQIVDKKEADLVLEGALTDYMQLPLRYDDDDNIEKLRIRIIMDLRLIDNRSGKTLWRESRFMGREDYTLVGINAQTKHQAVEQAVKDLSQRIVERTVEAW